MRGDEADIRWFGEEGDLFPRVWHHDPARRSSLDLFSEGQLRVRLRTESDIATATLVISRGREATGFGDDEMGRTTVRTATGKPRLPPIRKRSVTASPSAPSMARPYT